MAETADVEESNLDYACFESDELGDVSVENQKCANCEYKNLIVNKRALFRDVKQVEARFLHCPACKKYVSVWMNNRWHTLDSILEDEGHTSKQYITEVKSPLEKLTVFILSQIYHNINDLDTSKEEGPFLPFGENEKIKVVWNEGKAVGFYSLKLKGQQFPDSYERYAVNMVDTLYVQCAHRRNGFATMMLKDIVSSYPNEYVGISEPVSVTLQSVILKFLQKSKEQRDLFWSCTFTGEEGYRENLWLSLKTSS